MVRSVQKKQKKQLTIAGIETILKAILLEKDCSQYKPQLRNFAHNLPKVAAAAQHATGMHILIDRRVSKAAIGATLISMDRFPADT